MTQEFKIDDLVVTKPMRVVECLAGGGVYTELGDELKMFWARYLQLIPAPHIRR